MNINGINCKMVTVKLDVTCDSALLRQQLKPHFKQVYSATVKYLTFSNIKYDNRGAIKNMTSYSMHKYTIVRFNDAVVYYLNGDWKIYHDSGIIAHIDYRMQKHIYLNGLTYSSSYNNNIAISTGTTYGVFENDVLAAPLNAHVSNLYNSLWGCINILLKSAEVKHQISNISIISSDLKSYHMYENYINLGTYALEFRWSSIILRDLSHSAVLSVRLCGDGMVVYDGIKSYKSHCISDVSFASAFMQSKLGSLVKTKYIPQLHIEKIAHLAHDLKSNMALFTQSGYVGTIYMDMLYGMLRR